MSEPVIFELSAPGRRAPGHAPANPPAADLPGQVLRREAPLLPEVSELQVVRHFTRLSQQNFSIDTQFYPLGSCTMKYNPRVCNRLAMLPEFAERHPLGAIEHAQGFLECMYELQDMLKAVTGMTAVSLTPMAGAQGEFAGIAMIRAYHDERGDHDRREIIVPDAAHGTNPATATTNPSTLGVFERQITQIAEIVHAAGGLLYYDGANLNAILGRALPGDMGFDVIHLNLHKTFSTPHGGGGPGSGVVGVNQKLEPYLPVPLVGRTDNGDGGPNGGPSGGPNGGPNGGQFVWLTEADRPQSIGRLSAFMGNAGILLRAYIYIRLLGAEGMRRVSEFATLNANYLMKILATAGFEITFAQRRASHEFIVSLKPITRETGITAMDFAKALLDRGFHAPTTYFPLLVPECLLIEPTETETRQELDAFAAALVDIRDQAYAAPDTIKAAPVSMPVRRLDDVRAVKQLDVVWRPDAETSK